MKPYLSGHGRYTNSKLVYKNGVWWVEKSLKPFARKNTVQLAKLVKEYKHVLSDCQIPAVECYFAEDLPGFYAKYAGLTAWEILDKDRSRAQEIFQTMLSWSVQAEAKSCGLDLNLGSACFLKKWQLVDLFPPLVEHQGKKIVTWPTSTSRVSAELEHRYYTLEGRFRAIRLSAMEMDPALEVVLVREAKSYGLKNFSFFDQDFFALSKIKAVEALEALDQSRVNDLRDIAIRLFPRGSEKRKTGMSMLFGCVSLKKLHAFKTMARQELLSRD